MENQTLTIERSMELLNSIINHVTCARNTKEAIYELLIMGFEAEELINVFGFDKDEVEEVIHDNEE